MNQALQFRSAVPVLATDDVLASVRYFVETLSFNKQFVWGNPPVYAGVKLGDALIYFCHDVEMARAVRERSLHPEVFIWVTNIDAVYEEHKTRGVRLVEEISDRPWDARQYVILEPGGYHLKIAQPLGDD